MKSKKKASKTVSLPKKERNPLKKQKKFKTEFSKCNALLEPYVDFVATHLALLLHHEAADSWGIWIKHVSQSFVCVSSHFSLSLVVVIVTK